MSKRSYSGGTTALVIVLTLVIILIGIGFFFWMRIVGGGNELQHATDSGNLNVSKQVLKAPTIDFVGGEADEFGDLTDPSNNKIDLLVFDRLVGKSVLVSLNAAAEGTPTALANAKSLNDMVEGPSGIGGRLASALSDNGNLIGFFEGLSKPNTTRMLSNTDGNVNSQANETAVSYMARGKASNVYIANNQIPPLQQTFLSTAGNTVSKGSGAAAKTYLSGYDQLNCGISVFPQAVPMRPGEQPHLVDLNDFQQLNTSPLGGQQSQLPPNAFRSGGTAVEANQSGAALTMRSCSVIGTLNQDFPISLPRGYIVVDNTGLHLPSDLSSPPNAYAAKSSESFAGDTSGGGISADTILMSPSYVALAPSVPGVGDIFAPKGSDDVDPVQKLINDVNATPAKADSDLQTDISKLTQGNNMTPAQARAGLGPRPSTGKPPTPIQCIDTNTDEGAPSPNSDCQKNYDNFKRDFSAPVDPGSYVSSDQLMAVEYFKCYVLSVRSSVGADSCGNATMPKECTGLKAYDINSSIGLPCNFASTGTLSQLLSEGSSSPSATQLINDGGDIKTRLYQINPEASDSEISSVLNAPVAFGQLSFIYYDSKAKALTLTSTPPKFNLISTAAPDGAEVKFDTSIVDLNGKIVNVPEKEGYPNPWDCPALPANGMNVIRWQPSSGFNNLMGVLKFFNCASGGGDWCCPC